MKAITIKAPIAWAIFNADYNKVTRHEAIDCPVQIAIHVGKDCSKLDVEKFFRSTGIITPPANRMYLGEVIGIVTVEVCINRFSRWDWKLTNPIPINQFDYKGQPSIFEIPDSRIDYDCSKNPITQESGYKSKGNPGGQWRVTVWRHPYTENRYSYAVAITGGLMGSGISGHDLLHGCYGDPEEALQAGVKELYS